MFKQIFVFVKIFVVKGDIFADLCKNVYKIFSDFKIHFVSFDQTHH
jgi:hypothetical protein